MTSGGGLVAQFLFVVGSFAEGMVHFSRIQSFVVGAENAQAKGQLYKLKVGFPVFTTEGNAVVLGQLLNLASSDTLWGILDELHGVNLADPQKGLYFRKSIEVISNGEIILAQVYDINSQKIPKTAVPFESTDWQEWMVNNPPLTENLSADQKQYIKKLGLSSGREIVPINLSLYRELMKLELIVDKGRRLALSSLGKEAFRFLE